MADGFEHGREFTRVPLKLEAIVHGPTGCVFSGPARDIAMSGLYVQGHCEIPEGSPCSIEIQLGENDGPRVEANGQIVRVEEEGAAVVFSEIQLDSVEHLRNIVLYNAPDPQQIENEFASHLGLKRRS